MINKLDYNSQLSARLKKLEHEIEEMRLTLDEIKNNLQFYNQAERRLLGEMDSKLSLQLKSQSEEIHYLQYNLQKTQQSADSADKNCLDIKNILDKNLTKDDLRVVESFLRLIAANQMIQETYLHDIKNDHSIKISSGYDKDILFRDFTPV